MTARPPADAGPPPALRRRIGNVELLVISDGMLRSPVDRAVDIRASAAAPPVTPTAGEGAIWLGLNCTVVRTPTELVIVDTGFGVGVLSNDPDLRRADAGLFDALQRHGIDRADVTRVINTHLHTDHCGGNLIWASNGTAAPAFPNADYLVQRAEYEWALSPDPMNAPLYAPDDVRQLAASGRLGLLDGDRTVAAGIRVRPAVGHTPGHQIVLVDAGQGAVAITGDLAPMRIHVENPRWLLRGDVDPQVAADSRVAVVEWAHGARASVIPYHEPNLPWVEVHRLP